LNEDESISAALSLKTWAIVGLSNNADRPAFGVAALLQQKGHRIVPVHPKAETVHGERGFAKLSDIPFPIDVVDLFVNSNLVGPVVDEAIALKAKTVWLQLDVIDQDAVDRAQAAGLIAVMNRCPAIEYRNRN
jgi:uncharacterized protein